MSKMWGGRFQGSLDPFFESFNRSLGFDIRLAPQDLEVNRAWASALGRAGVLGEDEVLAIRAALDAIEEEWPEDESGLLASGAEDVHSLLESLLQKRVGDLAKRLHTGRSRNDQVATDLKLHLRARAAALRSEVAALMRCLAERAHAMADWPLPGYTHRQRAQPVTIGHHLLAYVEMLGRDRSRIEDALRRMDTCPLGSGALAGTAFDIEREALARDLGFGAATRNSLDAVSDRDHACEILFACSLAMVHLSRLADDFIFFTTREAAFVTFADTVATGSSLMPQKKNPDAMELIRGKAGRVVGALQGLLLVLKGLPLAYNKDCQEDKEGLFDALDTTSACLRVATVAMVDVVFHEDRCRRAASEGYMNATDLADLLVRGGVPFRDAHERVGRCVNRAVELRCELEDLPAEERRALLPELPGDLRELLSVEAVLARRGTVGGTAPERVREAAALWLEELR